MREFTCRTSRRVGGRVRVEVGGEVDLAVTDRLYSEIDQHLTRGASVELDCHDVTFIDSLGIGVMVRATQTAKARGATFTVADQSQAVQRVFKLAGLAGMFPEYQTRAESQHRSVAEYGPGSWVGGPLPGGAQGAAP